MPQSNISGLDGFIGRLTFRTPLSESDRQALLGLSYKRRSLKRHDFIVREDDKPQCCCVLLDGYAMRHKAAGNGGRQIFSIHMAGEAIDLQNSMLSLADHNIQMLSDGEAAFIPVEAIRDLALNHPSIGQAMWMEALVDGAILREWMLNVGRRDARSRMAHMLCEFALRLASAGVGRRDDFELPMTQEELSDALALTSIHVSRTLKSLTRESLLERTDRNIRIVDWHRLTTLGDFDSDYLHLPERSAA